jgi:hypothetical protein
MRPSWDPELNSHRHCRPAGFGTAVCMGGQGLRIRPARVHIRRKASRKSLLGDRPDRI